MSLFGRKKGAPDLGRGVDVLERDEDGGVERSTPASSVILDQPAAAPAAASKSEIRAAAKAAKLAEKARVKAEGGSKDKSAVANGKPGSRAARKAEKAERDAVASAAMDQRLSNMVMIDFYPGMAKEDALETARNWAMTHMDLPSMCFYYVHKIRDGYAVEVQEGVGKAYLPSVIDLAQQFPGRLIVVPMIRRKMTIFYSPRLGEFEAQILPELQEPPEMSDNPPIEAKRGASMTPVMKQYREWLIGGGVSAVVGGLALLSSLTFYAFDSKSKVPPEWRTTDVALLPVMQWSRLQADSTDSYVVRLEFQDGQWRIVRQAVGASVDVAAPTASSGGGQIEGGVLPSTGSPGVDAATAAPGGASPVPPPSSAPSNGSVAIPPPTN